MNDDLTRISAEIARAETEWATVERKLTGAEPRRVYCSDEWDRIDAAWKSLPKTNQGSTDSERLYIATSREIVAAERLRIYREKTAADITILELVAEHSRLDFYIAERNMERISIYEKVVISGDDHPLDPPG